jgi:hypothetical protein
MTFARADGTLIRVRTTTTKDHPMNSNTKVRRGLAALGAVAALAALPAGASAAHGNDDAPATEKVQAELEQMRTVVRADPTGAAQPEPAPLEELAPDGGRTTRAGLARELTSMRRTIEDRPREALFPFRRVIMSDARIAADGDARLRMACSDTAVEACQGIAWLTAEDGSLLRAGVFRVPAGEEKRVVLDAPGTRRRGGPRVVARAAVRDASGSVWTSSRKLALQA